MKTTNTVNEPLSWIDRLFWRPFLYVLGVIILKVCVKLTVIGQENIPDKGPLMLVGNHFGWFEAPLMYVHLPFEPIWFVARELNDVWLVRQLIRAYRFIPVWRGQVDRQALQSANRVLQAGGVIGIMPEGGIDPRIQDQIKSGIQAAHTGSLSRPTPELIRGRPGVSYIATRTKTQILPVAFINGEKVLPNIKQFRRTHMTMIIGKPFGPLKLQADIRGKERTKALQDLSDKMMQHIAELLPAEYRGFYKDSLPTTK